MLTVSQWGSRSGFTLVSLLILEGGCDQNEDCHSSCLPTGYWCYGNTWHSHTVLLCIFKALGRDELFTMELIWGKWDHMIPWKKWETQEGMGDFVTGYVCKSNRAWSVRGTRSQYKQRLCGLMDPGRWEPRRSFLLVLRVLKYLLHLFLNCWAWKSLAFAGQNLPSGFSVCGALACMEPSKHETWAVSWSLRAPEVSPVSSAMQMGVIHFAHFPPKKREKGWTEWGVALCPRERSSKGLLAEVENMC